MEQRSRSTEQSKRLTASSYTPPRTLTRRFKENIQAEPNLNCAPSVYVIFKTA